MISGPAAGLGRHQHLEQPERGGDGNEEYTSHESRAGLRLEKQLA
jgi:hypothetical protein